MAIHVRTCERHQEAITMKLARRAGTAAVVLFVGTGFTVYAQHGEQDEKQRPTQEQKKGKGEG